MEMEKKIWKAINIFAAALLLCAITAQCTIREVERRHHYHYHGHPCEETSSVSTLHYNTEFPSAASLNTDRFFNDDHSADGSDNKPLTAAPEKDLKKEEESEGEEFE